MIVRASGLIVLLTFALVVPVRGQSTWINPAGGSFSDGLNWSGGVAPLSNASITFGLAQQYTVTFAASHQMNRTLIADGAVDWRLDPHTFSSSNLSLGAIGVTPANSPGVALGVSGGSFTANWLDVATVSLARLSFRDGARASIGSISVGNAGGRVHLELSDPGTALALGGSAGLRLGGGAFVGGPIHETRLDVRNGATLHVAWTGSIELGSANSGPFSVGVIDVADPGSQVQARGAVSIANGTLSLANGAAGAIGTLTLGTLYSGTQSFGHLVLSDASLAVATLQFGRGGRATVGRNSSLILGTSGFGVASISAGGTVLLDDGSLLAAGSLSNSGMVTGSGLIRSGPFANHGSLSVLRVADGRALVLESAFGVSNSGVIEVPAGALTLHSFTNAANTGLISVRDGGVLRAYGAPTLSTNHGSILVPSGLADIHADVQNSASGRITVTGGSVLRFHEDLLNHGLVQVAAGSTAMFFGDVSGLGAFTGTGTVVLEGDLRPGASPGRFSFPGHLVAGFGSRLQIELAGVASDDYDQVVVGRSLTAEGVLSVAAYGGFMPLPGMRFDNVVQFAERVGSFELRNDTGLRGLGIAASYSPNALSLQLTGTPGDTNLDGAVDVTDLGNLASGWQQAGDWLQGDFNYDGLVDVADLGALATNWQAGVAGPAAPDASFHRALQSLGLGSVVPEPASLSLIALAAIGLRRRR